MNTLSLKMSPASASASSSSGYEAPEMIDRPIRSFYRVGGDYLEKMDVISEIFHRILTPLYGSQDKAITQIRESSDRRCFLMCENEMPAGVLMFKTVLSNEFAEFGIQNSIEIKSLFVDNAAQNSGKGLGSALVDKLKEEVANLRLNETGIHVTVSETKTDSLLFFKKKGFTITHAWKDRYLPGVTEYLLFCPTRIQSIEITRLTETLGGLESLSKRDINSASKSGIAQLVQIIPDAHFDDIHALKKLSDETFISGSKDNCLYKWNAHGERVCIVDEVEPDLQSERNWITAVEVINDAYWLSGQRNGQISLWETGGKFVKEIKLPLPKRGSHVSLDMNARRVTCLATGMDDAKPSFFVGFPTMFDEYNLIEGRTTSSTKVHDNDWMYAIHPLSKERMIGVIAATITLWEKRDSRWFQQDVLLAEERRGKSSYGKKAQRPFISALAPLQDSSNEFAIAKLSGLVEVLDITTKAITHQWNEHMKRVWSVEVIGPRMFATSGEDRSIKLWDTRSTRSIQTLADHIGQVTSLLSFSENLLIAGTCPENAIKSARGAEMRFYDLRK